MLYLTDFSHLQKSIINVQLNHLRLPTTTRITIVRFPASTELIQAARRGRDYAGRSSTIRRLLVNS